MVLAPTRCLCFHPRLTVRPTRRDTVAVRFLASTAALGVLGVNELSGGRSKSFKQISGRYRSQKVISDRLSCCTFAAAAIVA